MTSLEKQHFSVACNLLTELNTHCYGRMCHEKYGMCDLPDRSCHSNRHMPNVIFPTVDRPFVTTCLLPFTTDTPTFCVDFPRSTLQGPGTLRPNLFRLRIGCGWCTHTSPPLPRMEGWASHRARQVGTVSSLSWFYTITSSTMPGSARGRQDSLGLSSLTRSASR